MPWAAWSAARHVELPRCTWPMAWYHPIGSPHLRSHAYKWLAELVLHSSGLSTCLASHNDVICLHVL
jgi:hypothetical protein